MNRSDPPPILAKASPASHVGLSATVSTATVSPAATSPAIGGDMAIPPGATPKAVLDEIRRLITDHLIAARRLAARAASRFPDHRGITNANRILNEGEATVGSGENEPIREEEYEWLRHPPESARGKWVALLGSELVGMARSLAELIELLRSKNLERQALVHRIDA